MGILLIHSRNQPPPTPSERGSRGPHGGLETDPPGQSPAQGFAGFHPLDRVSGVYQSRGLVPPQLKVRHALCTLACVVNDGQWANHSPSNTPQVFGALSSSTGQ